METKKCLKIFIVICVFAFLPSIVFAKNVDITIQAEKEVISLENGNKIKKRLSAKEIIPGEIIIYTIRYKNLEKMKVEDIVIDDPIPKGTSYLANSAYGKNSTINFSIDNGVTFNTETKLYYKVKNNKGILENKLALPEQYTNIRWSIKELSADESGELGFKVVVN